MTSCRIWLAIAILRRSEGTCQAREFIVLSVEQKSVRGQIVCVHLPVKKKDRMSFCICSGKCTEYLAGQTVANNINVHEVDEIFARCV